MANTTFGADDTLITLDGTALKFLDWAIPSVVQFGGPYNHTVHRQPGGARQIDMLGDDPKPYVFSGKFIGKDAVDDFKHFEALKVAGNQTVLNFGPVKSAIVVITDLTWMYRSANFIEYKVECTPVLNGNNAAGQGAPNLGGAAGIPIGN